MEKMVFGGASALNELLGKLNFALFFLTTFLSRPVIKQLVSK